MEGPVVKTRGGLLVWRRIGRNLTHADTEVIILVPIGAVRGANVSHRAFVNRPQKRLPETLVQLVFTGRAAITHQQAVLALILQGGDVAGGKTRIPPAAGRAMRRVVAESHPVADVLADIRRVAAGRGVKIGMGEDPVVFIKVVDRPVIDLPVAMGNGISAIHPGNHYHSIQVGGFGHGVLFVHQRFVDLRLQLRYILRREPAIKYIREIIVGVLAIVKVGDMPCGHAVPGGDLCNIAHEKDEGRRRIIRSGAGIKILQIALDLRGGTSNSGVVGIRFYHREPLPGLPFDEWLQRRFKHAVGNDDILDRVSGEIFP